MIFEATGPFNAIGRIAMAEVEAALAAGWRVSVVATRLAETLQGRVEWLKLYNPPRGFALKWLTARYFIKKAMGDPSRFDLIYGHQPQIADLCDLFECHYLTRAVWELGCRDARPGLRGWVARLQEAIVLRAEDRCYGSWNPKTQLLSSSLTLKTFGKLYGLPPRHEIQIYPAPAWDPPSEAERASARQDLVGDWQGPVLGFLGGMNERKGYRTALDVAEQCKDAFLLFGGSHSEQVKPSALLVKRFRGVGLVEDVRRFYAAIDVLLVPSVFEPFGLVCFEAASRGVAVIASESVGALDTLSPFGIAWRIDTGTQNFDCILADIHADRDRVRAGCKACVETYSAAHFEDRVVERYRRTLEQKKLSVSKDAKVDPNTRLMPYAESRQ